MKKTIGIIGGMGPLATVTLFDRIVRLSPASTDQEHFRILIDNNTEIPDRTAYILNRGEDPLPHLTESAQLLEKAGADFLIMPCNTAHYFYDGICASIHIPLYHMIRETAGYVAESPSTGASVGLLATEGTVKSGIYNKIFEETGFKIVLPEQNGQKEITDLIYGIKAGRKDIDISQFQAVADGMFRQGCRICLLGCTELSVADEMFELKGNFVDPLTVIAKKAIKEAGA